MGAEKRGQGGGYVRACAHEAERASMTLPLPCLPQGRMTAVEVGQMAPRSSLWCCSG